MGVSKLGYRASIDALFAKTGGRIRPGLDRTLTLLKFLGHPHQRFDSFHVAGTNGKGSTCANLEALLSGRGFRVGKYSSPHLVDFRERVTVDGVAIPESEVVDRLDALSELSDRIGATFFEVTTALAFDYFAHAQVDVAVIETGLGGRFDSTNVIRPLVATVTNINFDHTAYLGDTLDQIAHEKAGIFKEGVPVVIGDASVGITTQLLAAASNARASAAVVVKNDWIPTDIRVDGNGTTFVANTPVGSIELMTPLAGRYQAWNTMTALASLYAATTSSSHNVSNANARYALPIEDWPAAIKKVRLPGRFQRSGDWIFDVAHNPAGAQVLYSTLSQLQTADRSTYGGGRRTSAPGTHPSTGTPPSNRVLLLGVMGDKEWRGMLEVLAPWFEQIVLTQPMSSPPDRAWSLEEVRQFAQNQNISVIVEPGFTKAIEMVSRLDGLKVVTGSFHTVGDAMLLLGIDPLKF